VRGQVEGSTVSVSIASTPLESPGGLARVISNAGSFLVSRAADGTFVAVTATCSHEACLITGLEGSDYVCDCHGSKFDTSGKVLFGPAETDLLRFGTAFSGGALSIHLE
jgi:Rieske Fe-S protein